MQSRLEPRSFFHVCRCARGNAGITRLYAAQPIGSEIIRSFSRARVGAVFRDPLRPTLSPATQRKRNDERWESMSVGVASPRNHLYRTPIRAIFTALRPTRKLDHVGDLAHELDRNAVVNGTDGDTLDKTRRISIASDRVSGSE